MMNPFGKLARGAASLALAAIICLSPQRSDAAQKVRIGYSLEYASEVLVNEVKVALQFLLTKVLEEQGLDAEFTFFSNEIDNRAAAAEGKVDMFDISAINYAMLSEEERTEMRPFIVSQHGEEALSRYVLLAAPGTELKDLRGKNIRRIVKRDRHTATSWLEAELWKTGRFTLDEYFGEITDCEESSEVVLPTFFGKADCCLVEVNDFNLLNELNPQISRRLAAVKESPELLTTIFLLRKDFVAVEEDRAVRIAEGLHENREGEQAFTLMRVKRLRKFSEDDMAGIREIAATLKEIAGQVPAEIAVKGEGE